MQKFGSLLLDVWRESCRHIHIAESTATMAGLLGRVLPIDRVIVRRFDPAHRVIETAGVGSATGDAGHEPVRTELTAAQMQRVLAWTRRHAVLRGAAGARAPAELAHLVPGGVRGDVLAAALGTAGKPVGVLLLVARRGAAFTAEHEAAAAALREPFTVALENDSRLRELESLRAAAEADRQALLTRLGRQELVDDIVGAGSGLRHVMERVALVAPSSVPVLIFGDTGTGKELVARTIHHQSDRAQGPFLRVNCGAIPPELVDSELFGHVRGSFTGAVADRRGWFERADGGTLFLDEVAELPLAAQVRLLTVVQDGWLERVGGQQPIKVDVRIVAATHRDLTAMVREGRFREDLWYRLAVFSIFLPPLRERPEDIPALAAHFAHRAATRFGLTSCPPTREDVALLVAYPWPGNVRELGAVIDRAAILGEGHKLEIAKAMGVPSPAATTRVTRGTAGHEGAASALPSLDEAMRRHIEQALAACGGRIEGPRGAAVLLRINPHTLRARMRKLRVERSRFRR